LLYHSPCLAEGQLASCMWEGQLRREMSSRWQNPHQIATMCAAASMTKGNLSEVYAPTSMMFLHPHQYSNTNNSSSLRNASERWLPVHLVKKSDLAQNCIGHCTLKAILLRAILVIGREKLLG
jgi:hypothetical protein